MTLDKYLLIILIGVTCLYALPTREGEADAEGEPEEKDERLLFEPDETGSNEQPGSDDEPIELSDAEAELLRQAKEQGFGDGNSGPAEGMGVRTGEEVAHGSEGDAHDESKQVEKPEEEQKGDPGPKEPMEELHGVLMHGDEEAGIEHEHKETAKEEEGETTVLRQNVGAAGSKSNERIVPDGISKTMDTEHIIHGEGADHVHDGEAPPMDTDGKDAMGGVAVESFMHDLMHGSTGDHDDEDADIKKGKAFRPRDLLKLGLDEAVLKGLDIKKLVEADMEDYNKYMAENGGDEESVWNIFNSFEFRYFKDGADIDDITSRQPKEEEWDDAVITQIQKQHEGEDGIEHLMEGIGNSGPLTNVHGHRSKETEE